MSNKRYGSKGTIITSGSNSHKSQTGLGSSSRTTSWGDPLSKRWENRRMRNPESSAAQNIDANRKHYVLTRLGVTNQGKMNRLKQALTHGSEPMRGASYNDAKTLDQKRWDSYNLGTELKYKEEYVPKRKK
jgi:hypothetical protein